MPNRQESRITLTLPANSLQCAFIGRVTQIKRPDSFLHVLSGIKKRGIDLDVFIVGDGVPLEMCRERIQWEYLPVAILGWQSDIERVLSSADIVVLASDNDGTP